eukprot:8309080-Pyramimonas_sp.AAC.1
MPEPTQAVLRQICQFVSAVSDGGHVKSPEVARFSRKLLGEDIAEHGATVAATRGRLRCVEDQASLAIP